MLNKSRIIFVIGCTVGFVASTYWMYHLYGQDFIHHTYLHHLSRLDHRHNFSPYHLTLYLSSALPRHVVSIPSLAFVPQLVIVGVVVPLALIGKDLATTMFAQTFAFVAFNKVCTSQVSLPLSSSISLSLSPSHSLTYSLVVVLIIVFHVVYLVSATLSPNFPFSSIS
jgi:phosphatidylinositol glycan class M